MRVLYPYLDISFACPTLLPHIQPGAEVDDEVSDIAAAAIDQLNRVVCMYVLYSTLYSGIK